MKNNSGVWKLTFLLLLLLNSLVHAQTTVTFSYTGSPQSWVVPAGVTSITVNAKAASGGNGNGMPGAKGGRVEATLQVTPGSTLYFYVGSKGSDGQGASVDQASPGGFNGGGNGGFDNSGQVENGGGGGGASDIRSVGNTLADRLVVVGGGGGGAAGFFSVNNPSGNGGGLVGQSAANYSNSAIGGGGGSQIAGGSAYAGRGATPGVLGNGGNGSTNQNAWGSAGGGGGYFGGGGGSGVFNHGSGYSAGGGGGSSYTDPVLASAVLHTQGYQNGNGEIVIIYTETASVTCPSNITVDGIAGQCGATVSFSATGTGTITYSPASGSFFPVGTTTVTVTSTISSSTASCTFTVTVNDVENPVITCPSNISVSNDAGTCGAVVNYNLPTVTDNCGDLPTSISGYIYQGTFGGHAYFLSNNTATATNANTQAIAIGGHLVTIGNAAENAFVSSFTPGLMWIGFTDQVTEGSFQWVNNEPVVYTNWNGGEPNDLGGEDWTVINWAPGGKWNDLNDANLIVFVVEFDGFPVTQTAGLPSGSFFPVGTTTNTFTTQDLAGNPATCSFTVTVTDDENPMITCPADVNHTADASKCSYTFTPTAPTATDNCPGVTVAGVRSDAKPLSDPYPVGTTTITWTATDAHSHTASCNQTVNVTDDENPNITCPANVNHTADAGKCSYTFTPTAATATDNCSGVTVGGVRSDAKPLSDPYPVGTTTITWTATDAHSHSVSCNQTVTVTDDEKPNAKCKNISVTLVNGMASITAADVNNNSTDNCAILSTTVSPNTFTCSNIGTKTVTLTVTDTHGNSQTCTATVTVVGVVPSCTITAIPSNNIYTGGVPTNIYLGYGPQSVKLSVNATGGSPFTYSWTGGGSLSCTNCVAPVFAPTTAGTYIFTVTVTNAYGCTTTCSITICVLDVRVPGTDGKKIYVCHLTNSTKNTSETIEISISAVSTHIFSPGHGDHLGTCNQVPCGNTAPRYESTVSSKGIEDIRSAFKIFVSPNPSGGQFKVQLNNLKGSRAELMLLNANGATIEKRSVKLITKGNTELFNLRTKASGVYFIKVVSDNGVQTEKIVIQR